MILFCAIYRQHFKPAEVNTEIKKRVCFRYNLTDKIKIPLYHEILVGITMAAGTRTRFAILLVEGFKQSFNLCNNISHFNSFSVAQTLLVKRVISNSGNVLEQSHESV